MILSKCGYQGNELLLCALEQPPVYITVWIKRLKRGNEGLYGSVCACVRFGCKGILLRYTGRFSGGNLLSMIRDNVNVYWESWRDAIHVRGWANDVCIYRGMIVSNKYLRTSFITNTYLIQNIFRLFQKVNWIEMIIWIICLKKKQKTAVTTFKFLR